MKVGIYLVGEKESYFVLGNLAVAVAKHTMPGIEVCHFTDESTKALVGASVMRLERDCPMAVLRMRHHQASGEWLFIDVDVLVERDVSDIFDASFDIAIASRVRNDGMSSQGLRIMPHNMGVVFSRSPAFWHRAERELLTYDSKLQEWMGDQLAVCKLVKEGKFDVRILPGEEYNYPPFGPDEVKASIVHYKGRRKPWMVDNAKRILGMKDEVCVQ